MNSKESKELPKNSIWSLEKSNGSEKLKRLNFVKSNELKSN